MRNALRKVTLLMVLGLITATNLGGCRGTMEGLFREVSDDFDNLADDLNDDEDNRSFLDWFDGEEDDD